MDEAAWLAYDDPEPMLNYLRDRALDRGRWLFACACWRRIWPLTTEKRREAVEAAERCADGAGQEALRIAVRVASQTTANLYLPMRRYWNNSSLAWSAARVAAQTAAAAACEPTPRPAGRHLTWHAAHDAERAAQAELMREIFANPFRPALADPDWLRWNDGAVVRLARSIYQERRFADLPVLADALEEAGCAEVGLLAHCRRRGGHARGCWVVDLLLGKS
jgi:hypothetical protein